MMRHQKVCPSAWTFLLRILWLLRGWGLLGLAILSFSLFLLEW